MSLLRRHIVGLISLAALSWTGAQTAPPPPKLPLDFSNEPCGNPLVESQLWYEIDGRVTSVEDGATVVMIMRHGQRRVTVHLVGIAVEQDGPLAGAAKGRLSSLVLNQSIGVWVNTDWLYQNKTPAEITGVVFLKQAAGSDVGRTLLTTGLARTKEPRPYSMSNYAFCKYREAESKAKSEKLGVWQ